jgi:hypothetical protein
LYPGNQIDEVIHKVAKMEPANSGGSVAAAPASDRRSSVGGRRHFSMSPPPNSLFPPQKPAIPLSRANVGSQTFLNFDETFRTPSQESTIALKKKSMPASGSFEEQARSTTERGYQSCRRDDAQAISASKPRNHGLHEVCHGHTKNSVFFFFFFFFFFFLLLLIPAFVSSGASACHDAPG